MSSGPVGARPRAALVVVRLASRLVTRPDRAGWRREWEAEILARWEALTERSVPTLDERVDLLLRACGSVVDAMSYGRGRGTMSGWGHDVWMAWRALARRPGFSALVIVTLGVAIGANTAIFGVARDVLLRPFPYPDPDRVVSVEELHIERPTVSGNVTYPNIFDLDAASSTFAEIGATRWWIPALEADDGSVVIGGATVTANFFDILGVDAGLGRFFRRDEEGPGRPPQVVISHALWMNRFGGDSGLVGREIRLSGEGYRVIGVTSADFEDPWLMDGPGAEPQVWRTVASPPSEWPRSGRSWMGIGRIREGVSLSAAREELDALFERLVALHAEDNASHVVRITPLRERVAGPAAPALYTLLASVGLLLLVACANLANLLLGRALDREAELTVHRALGAPASRVFVRTLAEALLLAGAGGVAGLGLAAWLGGAARRLAWMMPRPVSGEIDMGVLAFTLGATLLSAVLFGLAPALQASRTQDALPGPDQARGRTAGRRAQKLRRALVVAELAVTTALLIGSGLLVRSFHRLGTVDLGLRTTGVVGVDLHGSAWAGLDPDAARARWDAVLEAVRAIPGVDDAGAIDYLPLGEGYSCDGVQREDRPPPAPGEGRCAEVRVVLAGALETLGVPLVRGRLLASRDGADQPPVVVIDENMAEGFWPGEDPLGARIEVHQRTHEVVGVVGNMRHFGPGGAERPMLYLHAPQEGWNGIARGLALVARGADADALIVPVQRAVEEVSPAIALGELHTLEGLLDRSLAAPRFRTVLMVAFGSASLLLAVLGIAGIMLFSVVRRTRELGLRLALGAKPSEVRVLVLREAGRLVALGVGIGLVGAFGLAGSLERLLFEIDARDPSVYASVAVILGASALIACYVPALRASRVDPMAALVSE